MDKHAIVMRHVATNCYQCRTVIIVHACRCQQFSKNRLTDYTAQAPFFLWRL